jgi:trehalose utilization protein
MNAIIAAAKAMEAHIATALKGQQTEESLTEQYMKLTKTELVKLLVDQQKLATVTVESVCKNIMEDEACAWLSWGEIANAVSKAMGSNTSDKSIASYASKNTKNKGWTVPARKSTAARMAEMMKLA